MTTRHKKIETQPEHPVEPVADTPEVVVTVVETPAPEPVGATLPTTADEQLAGQIAIATAEDRLKAEIEAGKKAVAEAEARARSRTVE